MLVLSIESEQPSSERAVLLDVYQKGSFRLQLVYLQGRGLQAEFRDAERTPSVAGPIPSSLVIDRAIYVRVEIGPTAPGADTFELSLAVQDVLRAKTSFRPRLGDPAPATVTLGAAKGGMYAASFKLAEMMVFARKMSAPDLATSWAYVSQRYALKRDDP